MLVSSNYLCVFQMELLDKFPVEGGQKDPKRRIIPFLPGKRTLPEIFLFLSVYYQTLLSFVALFDVSITIVCTQWVKMWTPVTH